MPSRYTFAEKAAPELPSRRRKASAEIAVIQLHSLALGTFAEIEPLNPEFSPGHLKLRITVDGETNPRVPDGELLVELQDAFPGIVKHRCRRHDRTPSSRGPANGIVLLEDDSAANQAHLLEHVLLEMLSFVDHASHLSGVTCAYTSPPERSDVFVECAIPVSARITSLLAIDAINAALSRKPLRPLYPDALGCARSVLLSQMSGGWYPAILAPAAGIPVSRALTVLELFARAGIAAAEEYAMNFSAESWYRVRWRTRPHRLHS